MVFSIFVFCIVVVIVVAVVVFVLSSVLMGCVLIFVCDCMSSRFWFAMLEISLVLLGLLCVGFVLFGLEFNGCHGIDSCGLF